MATDKDGWEDVKPTVPASDGWVDVAPTPQSPFDWRSANAAAPEQKELASLLGGNDPDKIMRALQTQREQDALISSELIKSIAGGAPMPAVKGAAALSNLLGKATEAIKIAKIPRFFMERAVSLPDRLKGTGIGKILLDSGIWGRRATMLGDMSTKLGAAESTLQQSLPRVQGEVDPAKIANAVASQVSDLIPASGPINLAGSGAQEIGEAIGKAREIIQAPRIGQELAGPPFLSRPLSSAKGFQAVKPLPGSARSYSAKESIDQARSLGGYREGQALPGLENKLRQAEQGSLRGQAKDLASAQGMPEIPVALETERAMIESMRSLAKKPADLEAALGLLVKSGHSALAGRLAQEIFGKGAGLPVTIAAAGLRTPLGASALAQGLHNLPSLLNPATRSLVLQSRPDPQTTPATSLWEDVK